MTATQRATGRETETDRDWTAIAERLQADASGIVPVSKAARFVPTDRGRRGYCSANALVSWILRGKRGVFLDGLKGPGKSWWTSREAIARFLVELSARAAGKYRAGQPGVGVFEPPRVERERLKRARAAMAELGAS